MHQDLATGILVKEGTELNNICEHCITGKQHQDPFPNLSAHRLTELLGRILSDLHGPLAVQTPHGYRYWITFIDDHSWYKEVVLLKQKSDAFQAFKDFVAKHLGHMRWPPLSLVQLPPAPKLIACPAGSSAQPAQLLWSGLSL
ncbi:hypothetical protein NMY22_g1030 [Coprinellus aureogranulatus]|nr:hypothetical protein NMY22_g1030 [Coprinellus aureogranulatus]